MAQNADSLNIKKEYKHSFDISPMSPLFNIWAIQYSYQFSPKNEIILGLVYANIKYHCCPIKNQKEAEAFAQLLSFL